MTEVPSRSISVEFQPVGRRRDAIELARRAHYLELTTHPAFADRFAEAMPFACTARVDHSPVQGEPYDLEGRS